MCGHNNTIGLIIIEIEENYLHSFALSPVSIKGPLPSSLVMSHENTIAIANDLAARRPLLSLAVVVHAPRSVGLRCFSSTLDSDPGTCNASELSAPVPLRSLSSVHFPRLLSRGRYLSSAKSSWFC